MSKNNDYILTTMGYLQNLGIAVDNLGQLPEKAVHKLPNKSIEDLVKN